MWPWVKFPGLKWSFNRSEAMTSIRKWLTRRWSIMEARKQMSR